MIRVQIADDHELIVRGLQATLQAEPDLQVVMPLIQSGAGLLKKIDEGRADVLLLDMRMPDFEVFTALGQITARGPKPYVLILTAHQDPLLVRAAAEKGAAGYILKEEALCAQLPSAIREVARGRKWFSPGASQYLLPQDSRDRLTHLQYAVLRLMVQGKAPDDVADILSRSVKTIYRVQAELRDRLGVLTNEQVIVTALRQKVVALEIAG